MTTVELAQAPGLRGLYAKAASAMLPGRGKRHDGVPDTALVLRQVRADRHRLAEYARVCGFPLTDTMPATYPHVLAFPLALQLMTTPDFPFPAVRVIHLANRIEQHRPLGADEPLDLTVSVADLRPHERGRQVDVVAEASVGGEQVWRDVSTYLHREGKRDGERPASGGDAESPEPTAVWRVSPDVGPAYAAVSGDRNPIHVSNLAARAFGFRRRIAHGMWTKARCLAQLAPRLPEAYDVDATFRAPILLPSTVNFTAQPTGEGWRLVLRSARSGRPHLYGTVTRR
jgi:acyl dehydratase